MIIDCVADLHGNYPGLAGGDLLIVAGDWTAHDAFNEVEDFEKDWLRWQPYKKIILIAGNHDNMAQQCQWIGKGRVEYLCDSGTEFEGLKIWGSPWTLHFPEINPNCRAFTGTEDELNEKFSLIPNDTDILITHGPPYSILDISHENGEYCGSRSLLDKIGKVKPKLHVFGHIHECYGQYRPNLEWLDLPGYPVFVNCSHVNERYEPVNGPIRVILDFI